MKLKKVLSAVLAFATLTLGTASTVGSANAIEVETKDTPQASAATVETEASEDSNVNKQDYDMCDNIADGAILHAFCWSFKEIEKYMPQIAAAGYTAVQTSPASKCYDKWPTMSLLGKDVAGYNGHEGAWWWLYQPIELSVGNYQLGTNPQDYKDMCDTAHKYGVKIITDIVANHTTAEKDENGNYAVTTDYIKAVTGSETYNAKTIYHEHYTDKRTDKNNRSQMIDYMNSSLPDVDTENELYQAYLVNYLNELISLGCDGFRFDMAVNIGGIEYDKNHYGDTYDFWDVVTGKKAANGAQLTKTSDELFIYGEILGNDGYNHLPEYGNYISVTASSYGDTLRSAIGSKNFSLSNINNWGGHPLSSDKLVTWVESHDSYWNINETVKHESGWMSDTQIKQCWAVIAARDGGTPLFFNRPNCSDNSGSNYVGNNKIGEKGNDLFQDTEVAAVNHFRNAMVGENEQLRNINGDSKILQIDRGKNGTCIINLNSNSVTIDTPTNMSDGTYTDYVSGRVFTVENGNIKGTLDAGKIAVIYQPTNMKLSASPVSKVFTGDTLNVTLSVSNTDTQNGTYTVTVDGVKSQENVSFTNGQTVELGKDLVVGDKAKEIILTITANDGTKDITKNYIYKKRNTKKDPVYIYFDKTSNYSSWSNVGAYVYLDDNDKEASWPGTKMEIDSETGYYRHKIPDAYIYGNVIFNDNKSSNAQQYPANGYVGLKLHGESMLFGANKLWEEYDAPKKEESVIPDEDTDLKTYNYLYFFNSMGWEDGSIKAELIGSKNTLSGKLKWSDDLHCYYFKYDIESNYSTVTFSGTGYDSNNNAIPVSTTPFSLAENKGLVFVPASSGITDITGEWISLDCIQEHTIYFNHFTSWTNTVNAYMYREISNNVVLKNEVWPGVAMTKTENSDPTKIGLDYSYTYYYPRLNKSDATDYEYVIFNDGTYETKPLAIQSSTSEGEVYVYTRDNPDGKKYEGGYSKLSTPSNTISITVHYTNYRVNDANTSDDSVFKEETKDITINNVQIKNGNLSKTIFDTCKDLKMTNLYDDIIFYSSQFEYVSGIASLPDSRIEKDIPYSASLNPSNLAKQSTAFSGIYKDSENFIENLNAASDTNWITFYNGNDPIDFNKINSSFSNVTRIELYAFDRKKDYNVHFYYPTDSSVEPKYCINNGKITCNNNKYSDEIYTCQYNQILTSAVNDLTEKMKIMEGYTFDGWYSLNFNSDNKVTSYLKISSEQDYKYRITNNNLNLYAVFKQSNTFNPGVTTLTSGIDKFNDGTDKYRYNTVFNVYDCNDYDTKISDVAVIYVKTNSGTYNLEKTRENLKSELAKGSSTDNQVIINNDSINNTADYNCYVYNKANVKLTAKNRLQFILTLKKNQAEEGTYKELLAFTAMKYNGEWIISDNCVEYKNVVDSQDNITGKDAVNLYIDNN